MEIAVRHASGTDVPELVRLYRLLEAELTALKPIWRLTEGLAEPLEQTWERLLEDPDTSGVLATVDGVPAGFLLGRSEALLPQGGDDRMAAIRLIFTEPGFRKIGVGEALIDLFITEQRAAGHRYFDAHVPPGHRIAKNFFEANGFKARHIVMHREA